MFNSDNQIQSYYCHQANIYEILFFGLSLLKVIKNYELHTLNKSFETYGVGSQYGSQSVLFFYLKSQTEFNGVYFLGLNYGQSNAKLLPNIQFRSLIYSSNFIQLKHYGSFSYLILQLNTNNVTIIIGGMQQTLPEVTLTAKIKCGVFKELFNQILKNIKTDKSFYMYVCRAGIQMTFMQSGKEVQIEVFLSNQVFHLQYDFSSPSSKIYKFDIRDMEIIGIIFENTSSILNLTFRDQLLTISYQNQFSGECIYKINALVLERQSQIPKQVGNIQIIQQLTQPCTQVKVIKAKMISHSLSTLSSFKKYQNIQIQFQSNTNKINIVPVPTNYTSKQTINSDINFKTPVKFYDNAHILSPIRFSLRKIKSGLVLFDKNQQINLTFFDTAVKMQSASKQKKQKKNIVIMIAAAAQ